MTNLAKLTLRYLFHLAFPVHFSNDGCIDRII